MPSQGPAEDATFRRTQTGRRWSAGFQTASWPVTNSANEAQPVSSSKREKAACAWCVVSAEGLRNGCPVGRADARVDAEVSPRADSRAATSSAIRQDVQQSAPSWGLVSRVSRRAWWRPRHRPIAAASASHNTDRVRRTVRSRGTVVADRTGGRWRGVVGVGVALAHLLRCPSLAQGGLASMP